LVFDFFAGSGTTGAACLELGRRFILIDNNPTALEVMARRFTDVSNIEWINFYPKPFQDAHLQDSIFES
jgi:site-specific DNA-methyltransferase (adenine-specific)